MKVKYSHLETQFADAEDILDSIRGLLRTGQFTLGPQVEQFERRFAARCGAKHAIGVNSGTDALMLILRGLGIGPGDEVITAPNSFIATAAAYLGYKAGDLPVREAQAGSILTLPVHQDLADEQRAYVCDTIHQFYARAA